MDHKFYFYLSPFSCCLLGICVSSIPVFLFTPYLIVTKKTNFAFVFTQ